MTPEEIKERRREANRRWREANAEQERERHRDWRSANPDKALAANRRWYSENTKRARKAKRQRYLANLKREQERSRAWQAANPQKRREANRQATRRWKEANASRVAVSGSKRRALKQGATVGDLKAIAAIYEKAKSALRVRCAYCGKFPEVGERHVDHAVPLVNGGPHTAENLRIACAQCNLSKGTKTAEEFMTLLLATESRCA